MDEQGEMEAFTRALDRFSEKADRLLNTGNMNTAKIEVNAGGVGVWVAASSCAVMLVLNIALLFMLAGHDRKIERLQDYLQAIYAQAPHLKPKED